VLFSYSKPLGPDCLGISSDTWLSKGRDGVGFSATHNGSQSRLRDRAGAFSFLHSSGAQIHACVP